MKFLVLGSCRHLDDGEQLEFAAACEALGEAFSRAGETFILCSRSPHTADPHILKGVRQAKATQKVTVYEASVQESDGELAQQANSQDQIWKDITVRTHEGEWRTLHLRAIREADAVLAIGGSSRGTQTSIYSAELLSKPVILIPSFGGACSESWGYFRGRYYLDEEADTLYQRWASRPEVLAKSICGVSRKIIRRYHRNSQSRLERSGLIALTIISLAIWTYLMFGVTVVMPPAAALCLLLATASVSGSLLRIIARRVGALTSQWAEDNAAFSIILGLLIGFGLLLVGGFANLALNGKLMTVANHDDARRIGFSLSPILFLVGLFVEQAWARLNEKGMNQLRKS